MSGVPTAPDAAVHPRPVVLIGPMAAGKSAVGQTLRTRHGYRLIDSDARIVAAHGTIPEIFAHHDEAHFRRLEAAAIGEILADPDSVGAIVSVGGGAPMTPAVARLLAETTVVYLLVDEQTVADRIRAEGDRPLLAGHPLQRWRQMYAQRHETYERLADLVVDARGHRDLVTLADEIHEHLARAAGKEQR
ncbi:shikimate kinase [Amycolatopsis sp. H6(2020)]|uniref:Shikimate kinase n=1 Tax=Rothia kristinae TaxID=37923 RepID=A0A7T4MU45_9MICC|nr:shikimate kinase [Rothia kristinae]MBE8528165.1 shikimate kinase [Amycolatopsis sp. H6(2020)]MDN5639541.1 shikimate kinase [Actinomycetes bacterium]QQC59661.1 shikimate kinase [Rothia kristinae]